MKDRIVEVSLDGLIFSFEIDQPDDMTEDQFYEYVINYVLCNINVEVI